MQPGTSQPRLGDPSHRRSRVSRMVVVALGALAVLAAAWLLFGRPGLKPGTYVAIEPVAWAAPADAGYTGPFAPNTRLANLRQIPLNGEAGPEHVAFGPDGKLYASVERGKILRMNADGSSPEVWASTGGRVLGFDFDRRGRLIAADAMRGLIAVESAGEDATVRKITVLADKVRLAGGDDPIRYANAAVLAADGKIYFTDSSRRFTPAQFGNTLDACIADLFEHSATGRVLVHDPATSTTEVLAAGFSFANGVALSAAQDALFVAETGEYRIWRIALGVRGLNVREINANGGRRDRRAQVVLDNLPGHPDNLMRGADGRIWAGLVAPRSRPLDAMAGTPFVRRIAWRLKPLFPLPPGYGHVFAFDEAGHIVADLQDPSGKYPDTTGVTETADRLYIQNLHSAVLGWLPRNAGRP